MRRGDLSNLAIFSLIIYLLITVTNADTMCDKKCICKQTSLECKGLTQVDLESDTFQNTIKADYEKITITDGNIKELQKNIFGSCARNPSYKLDKLAYLDLSRNHIKIIHGQTFHCMPNLHTMRLAENQWNISAIHTHIFSSLPNLKKLNLTDALHDGIEGHIHLNHLNLVFLNNDLRKLEVLTLDYNGFTIFGDAAANALCSFPALKRLKLSNNLIQKVTLYHKTCLPHLENLDLSHNNINTFDDYGHSGLLYALDSIQSTSPNMTVNFVGNEFDCDCGLLEFHNWLKRTKVHVIHRTQLTCHDGLLYNRTITSVKTDQFKCYSINTSTSSNRGTIGVLVTMFVLIALILIVVAYLKRESIKRFVTSFKKPSLAREHLFGYSTVNNENATDYEV